MHTLNHNSPIEINLDLWLQQLIQQGVELWVEGEHLRIRAPQGILTPELRAELTTRKAELVTYLQNVHQSSSSLPTFTVAPEARYEPFPLTDIQFAYWVGQTSQQELSNGYHYYMEYECQTLDIQRLTQAWQKLIQRHDMLRGIVLPSGQQQVLQEIPLYEIEVTDLNNYDKHEQEAWLHDTRSRMSHQLFSLEQWPLFEICVARLSAERFRLHISWALIMLDAGSINILLQEWQTLYDTPDAELPPVHLSYRDYVLWEQNLTTTQLFQRARDYWLGRLDVIPAAPDLPLKPLTANVEQHRTVNRKRHFSPTSWETLQQRIQQIGITPTALLTTVFAEVLAIWSKEPRFTLNLTFFNRLPAHSQINDILGDFTSINLLTIDFNEPHALHTRVQQIHRQLWTDLEHRTFNGVLVIRELARRQQQGGKMLMPIVFTSMLGLNAQVGAADSTNLLGGKLVEVSSQTPQVLFDAQVEEVNGELIVSWDTADEFFPPGMLDDMFSIYCERINALAASQEAWHVLSPTQLPSYQPTQHKNINATSAPFPDKTLPELFLQQVERQPNALAIHALRVQLSYKQVYQYANQIGHWLRGQGVKPNQLVAIVMEKGWEQIVGVLGTLFSGAAYLPIDPELPDERRDYLLENGEVHSILSQSQFANTLADHQRVQTLYVDSMALSSELPPLEINHQPDDLAYVLYTSGSTGKPKGVMIEQRSVVNRMTDIAQRFQLKKEDRALALTALHHDLSVFDIFAILTIVGGTVVLPNAEKRLDPAHWVEVIRQGQVTLWNSVPAFMQMLIEHLEDSPADAKDIASLRWVILSGDFIPVTLPERMRTQIPDVEIISAGGPTETTVWDICYPIGMVDPAWASIPYGQPMHNAQYYVLKDNLDPCPTWVERELYIAGTGLARGYWRDPERTNASFITHPRTGQRLYRSGDMGRYIPGDKAERPNIEILGRRDFQVKLRGQRIELGEIEVTLLEHPTVNAAVVNAVGDPKSPNKQLVAYVVCREVAQNDDPTSAPYSQDIDLTDPLERAEFKLSQRGLRSTNDEPRLPLAKPIDADARQHAYLRRQSYRQYTNELIPADQFGEFLACLSQMALLDTPLPKYLYPSAGGLYPVQTYLYVKSDRIADIVCGYYYYDPKAHELVQLSVHDPTGENLFTGVNQPIFEQSAFALFLVTQLDAITPMYGDLSRDFCLLEAGYISQLLMMQAPTQQLGLCPIGGLEEEWLKEALQLTESQFCLHSLVGGRIDHVQMTQWLEPAQPTQTASSTQTEEWQEDLFLFLQAKLPPYMVPTAFVELDALPLSANGKVDRRALPVPDLHDVYAERSRVAPRTSTEERIAEIWCQVLNCQQPSIEHDFFEMGGDSLMATRLLTRLRKTFSVELSLRTIFANPTIEQLAGVIEAQSFEAVDADLLQAVLAEVQGEKIMG